MKRVFFLFVSVVVLFADTVSFRELTALVSSDLKKNIYLDTDLENYILDLNLPVKPSRGQLFAFYNEVLSNNGLVLKYNKTGDFFYVRKSDNPQILPPKPLPSPSDEIRYYTYRIKHITNDDVANAMSIFPDVKYKFLPQSDLIVFGTTERLSKQVFKILSDADNSVRQSKIKITLYAVNRQKLEKYGSQISKFGYSTDVSFDNIIGSLVSGVSSSFTFSDSFQLSIFLTALENENVAHIFQSPTVALTNGVETSVDSVSTIPYLKVTSVSDSNVNQVTEQYDYKDVGLKIKVLPKIKSDFVYLDLTLISEELISIDEYKPITQKITYKNSITLRKGKPVLLTGIKKSSTRNLSNRVPTISNIPFFGWFFRGSDFDSESSDISILIELI